jgi:large subunit ribosomal protein L10
MSKTIKKLLREEVTRRLEGVKDLAVVGVVGIDGVTNNRMRGELQKKGIDVMVVKNAMARQAFAELGLKGADDLLDGPCALAFGGESLVDLVREMFDRTRTVPKLVVKGAYMEGEVFGPDRIEALSKYPTRIEALGRLSSIVMSPGAKLVGAVVGPGAILAGILKTIQEKQEAPESSEEAPAA